MEKCEGPGKRAGTARGTARIQNGLCVRSGKFISFSIGSVCPAMAGKIIFPPICVFIRLFLFPLPLHVCHERIEFCSTINLTFPSGEVILS